MLMGTHEIHPKIVVPTRLDRSPGDDHGISSRSQGIAIHWCKLERTK
jgi:hypothetical protein